MKGNEFKQFLKGTIYETSDCPDYAPCEDPITGDEIKVPTTEDLPDYIPSDFADGDMDSDDVELSLPGMDIIDAELEMESAFADSDGSHSGDAYEQFEDDYSKTVRSGSYTVE